MTPLTLGLQFELSHLVLPLGITLIVMWLMLRLRRRRPGAGQGQGQVLGPEEQSERYRQARGLRGDLEQVMVEVEELARRFSAQLDAKALMLEKLLAEADQRIARLEQLRRDAAADSPPQPPSPEPPHRQVRVEPPAAPAAPAPNAAPADPLTRSVYQMADAGSAPLEIARALNEHVGKVELILALRNS